MMALLGHWFIVVSIGSMAVMTPGPNFFMTIRNSAGYGKRAGIWTAIGLGAADLVSVTVCLTGIGLFLAESSLLFQLLKWCGAAFLIYIGIGSVNSKKRTKDEAFTQGADCMPWHRAFRIGLTTCLLNPKVTLFFLAFFTQMIDTSIPTATRILYGVTIAGLECFWLSLVANIMSAPAIRSRYLGFSHWIERLMGCLLITLGVSLGLYHWS